MSEKDMYQVCVIVARGWKLEFDGWKKDGVIRELSYNEKESNGFSSKHGNSPRFDGTEHSLEQAFNYEENNA